MRRIIAGVGSAALAVTLLTGCPPSQAAPKSIPDGVTPISKNMVGFWNAPGGQFCRWWITKDGQTTNNGNTKQKLPVRAYSQKALISTADIGGKFHSDGCANSTGGWKQ